MIQKLYFILLLLFISNTIDGQSYNYPRFQSNNPIFVSILGYSDPSYIIQNKKLEMGLVIPESVQQRVFNFVEQFSSKVKIFDKKKSKFKTSTFK